MTAPSLAHAAPRSIGRRQIEFWATGAILAVQSGAVLPLMFMSPDGSLSDGARGTLRLFGMATYCVSLLLLLPHLGQLQRAMRRNLPFVLLLGLTFASVLWSISPSITLRRAVGLAGATLIAYFIAIRFTPREICKIVAVMLLVTMWASLALAALSPSLAFMPYEGELRGVFLNKNSLGWVAGAGVMIAVTMLRDKVGSRVFSAMLLTGSLVCLALSGSMTGAISLVVAAAITVFYIVLQKARGFGRSFVTLLFLQILALILFGLSIFLVPMLEALGKDATLTGRIPLWQLVDQQIANSPLIGYGYEAFWTEGNFRVWGIWAEIGWNAPHSHMGYREIMLGLGIPGILLLAIVMIRALRQGMELQLRNPQDGWLWLNIMLGMLMIMNITESLFLAGSDLPWILGATAILMFSTQRGRRQS